MEISDLPVAIQIRLKIIESTARGITEFRSEGDFWLFVDRCELYVNAGETMHTKKDKAA